LTASNKLEMKTSPLNAKTRLSECYNTRQFIKLCVTHETVQRKHINENTSTAVNANYNKSSNIF